MSPKTELQLDGIREARKELIMTTAMELFAYKGYHATSIREIAKAANISKGLMYNYFESKEVLLIAIVNIGMEKLMEWFDPNHDGHLTSEEIEIWINKVFETLQKNTKFWKIYFTLFIQPEVFKVMSEKFNEFLGPMYEILINYFKNSGYPNPEIDALIFGAIFDGVAFNYIINPDNFPLEAVKNRIIELYVTPKK